MSYASAPPSKRHRLDPAATPSQLLGDLPHEVLLRMVSFSDQSTRLTMARTSKFCREAVEDHEKRVYEEIKRVHRAVDETFDARVGDQTNLATTITGREKPVDLPYRYRKIVAMKTSLYSFLLRDNDYGRFGNRYPSKIIVSPSGDRIVVTYSVVGDPLVYDLSAQRFAGILTLDQEAFIKHALFLDDDRILTSSNTRGLHTFTLSETGDDWDGQMFLPVEPAGWVLDWTRNGQEILALPYDEHERFTLLSINISERSARRTVVAEGEAEAEAFNISGDIQIVGLSRNNWLLCQDASAYETPTDVERETQCAYLAYNLETKQTSRFLSRTENYDENKWTHFVHQMSSGTYCGFNNGRLLVYGLEDDGHLAERCSFPVPFDREPYYYIHADYKSQVFVGHGRFTKAFDVDTGECVRSIGPFTNGAWAGPFCVAVAKRRKELLILERGEFEHGRVRIKAVCLEEPCVVH